MNAIILSIAFNLVFMLETITAGFVLIANRRAAENRAIALLLVVFGLNSLSYGTLFGTFSLDAAVPWIGLFLITTYTVGPAIYIATVAVLRPRWFRHKWLYYPIYLLSAFPLLAVLADAAGLTTRFLASPLLFVTPNPQAYTGGIITLQETAFGLLSPFMLFFQVGFPLLAVICPIIVVGVRDWKPSPVSSRIAWAFLLATVIGAASQVVLADSISIEISSLIANLGFVLVFGLASIKRPHATWNLRAIRRALDDWPVFAKLVLVVVTVFIPTIFMITLVSGSIVRTNMTEQIGNSFNALARLEARNLSDRIRIHTNNLERVSISPVLQSALNLRAQETRSLSPEQVKSWLNREELDWVVNDQAAFEQLPPDFLSSLNILTEFQATFPEFTYLQLTDANGGLISATSPPKHFDFSNAGWWRAAYDDGRGQVFMSVPLRNPETGNHYLQIVLPIFARNRNAVVGILMAHFQLDEVFRNLADTRIGELGRADLFSPGGILIPLDADDLEHLEGTRGSALPWDQLDADPAVWHILEYASTTSIVSWTPVENLAGSNTAPWRVMIHQPVSEALLAVTAAQQASLLTTLLTTILGFGFAWVLSGLITRPITSLTQVAQKVLEGDLDVQADITGKDEVGILANTFNTMTAQVRNLVTSLESQVRERTSDLERQALKLQAAAEVGQGVLSILNTDDLVRTTVDIIRERFDLYYVGLFLVDEAGEWAVLQAGTGEAGEQMLGRGHRIRVGEGMIGWSVQNSQTRVAGDAATDAVRLLTPELPNTRSEAAIPMRARGQTIGALTVQSTRADEFDQTSLNILQSLADQVGTAVDNVNLLEQNQASLRESREALDTVRRTYRQVTREAWTETTQKLQWGLVATPEGLRWKQPADSSRALTGPADVGDELAVPIKIRDHHVGTIRLRKPENSGAWSPMEKQYIESYIDQLGLALDSARLFQDIQNRSLQLETSAEVGRAASSILRVDELLPTAVNLIGERFQLYYTGVFMVDETGKWAVLRAGTGEAGEKQLEAGHKLEVGGKSMIGQCIETQEVRLAMDVGEEAVRFENPELPDTRTEMALPLVAGGKSIGALTIQSMKPAAFTKADITVFQTMANQLATAIQNAALYEQSQEATDFAQEQRRIADALLKSSARFSTTQDQEVINDILIEEIDDQVRPDQINIFFWDENQQRFMLVRRYTPGDPEDDYEVGQMISPEEAPILWRIYSEAEHDYDPEWREDGFVHEKYRLPLRLANLPIGVIEIYHTARDAHIRPEDRAIIDGILQQASVAIQSAQTFRQTQEALARTEALYLVGQAASNMENLATLLQSVANTIADTLPAKEVSIVTLDLQGQKVLNYIKSSLIDEDMHLPTFKEVMDSMAGWVVREQRWALSPRAMPDDRESEAAQENRRQTGEGSRLVVPLMMRGRVLGAITAINDVNFAEYDEQDADLMVAMALQVSVAIQNSELYAETQITASNERLLNQIGSQLTQSLDFETILRTAVEEIGQLPNITNVTLTVGNKKTNNGDEAG